MRKICFPIAALILVVCGLWKANHGYPESEGGITTPSRAKHPDSESISDREPSGVFRTKVANREPAGPRATHAPERLKEFMLPEVVIDGLTLGEALQKLMGVYEETCGKTGETPLRRRLRGNPRENRRNSAPTHLRSTARKREETQPQAEPSEFPLFRPGPRHLLRDETQPEQDGLSFRAFSR